VIREPAVAGKFYPDDRGELLSMLENFCKKEEEKYSAFGVVSPHAGYIFSGKVAGEVFSSVKLPEKFVILCPNHTGFGSPLSIMSKGAWRTPLGLAKIDEELSNLLKSDMNELQEDPLAHRFEHSLEVQLPFIQFFKGDNFSFVPICVGTSNYDLLVKLGESMGNLLKKGEDFLIVASSDMTHYEDSESAKRKDFLAIEKMENLDVEGFYRTIREYSISMCGFAPVTAAMVASKIAGAKRGKLIKYTNSGDVIGDYSSVVAYAGIVFI